MTPKRVTSGRQRIRLGLFLAGSLVALTASYGAGAGDVRVDIRVFNRSFRAIEVRIYDLVCGHLIFAGEIMDNASVIVPGCPDQDGRATITIVDQFGHQRTYQDLISASNVELPFQSQ